MPAKLTITHAQLKRRIAEAVTIRERGYGWEIYVAGIDDWSVQSVGFTKSLITTRCKQLRALLFEALTKEDRP